MDAPTGTWVRFDIEMNWMPRREKFRKTAHIRICLRPAPDDRLTVLIEPDQYATTLLECQFDDAPVRVYDCHGRDWGRFVSGDASTRAPSDKEGTLYAVVPVSFVREATARSSWAARTVQRSWRMRAARGQTRPELPSFLVRLRLRGFGRTQDKEFKVRWSHRFEPGANEHMCTVRFEPDQYRGTPLDYGLEWVSVKDIGTGHYWYGLNRRGSRPGDWAGTLYADVPLARLPLVQEACRARRAAIMFWRAWRIAGATNAVADFLPMNIARRIARSAYLLEAAAAHGVGARP